MKQITNSSPSERDEALAWLGGALRWERVLDGLREADTDDTDDAGDDLVAAAPRRAVPEAPAVPAELPARRSEAA